MGRRNTAWWEKVKVPPPRGSVDKSRRITSRHPASANALRRAFDIDLNLS